MASIELKNRETLVVRLHGWDRLWALRRSLEVPLSHVASVRAHPREAWFDDVIVDSWSGVGTYERGWIAAGVIRLADGPSFYDVRDPERVVAIDLVGEAIRHIVVEVDGEPEQVARDVREALGERTLLTAVAEAPR